MSEINDYKNKGLLAKSFYSRVSVIGECWEWQGAINANGYGHIRFSNKTYLAHRLSYEFAFKPITKGLFVCHKCDNPKCVRPDHLFLGTPLDNTLDMMAKGRARPGGD